MFSCTSCQFRVAVASGTLLGRENNSNPAGPLLPWGSWRGGPYSAAFVTSRQVLMQAAATSLPSSLSGSSPRPPPIPSLCRSPSQSPRVLVALPAESPSSLCIPH